MSNDEIEIKGNPVIVSVGCEKCPANLEVIAPTLEDVQIMRGMVGSTVECPNCKGRWTLERVQVRGLTEMDQDEWRVCPRYSPVISSFVIQNIILLEVPTKLLSESEEE